MTVPFPDQLPQDQPAADPSGIASALDGVRARMGDAARSAGRAPSSIELVAVSKFQPQQSVLAALAAGQRVFGENRVQEAAVKFDGLHAAHPDLELHLIGPIQTNKAADAVRIADVIETVDRPRLADALDAAAQKQGRLPALLVQVNIGEEPQKAGIAPGEADGFIALCQRRFGARLVGLMAIPPAGADPSPFFGRMASLAAAHGLPALSMGMSDDFDLAIRHGATSVRIGSAIFGARPLHPPADTFASGTLASPSS